MADKNQDEKGTKKGPWGSRGKNKENDSSSGGQNPWGGQRPSSGSGDDLPEMEEILRQAHESLGGFFSNGGRGGSRRTALPVMGSGKMFTLLLAAVLVLWAATGLYRVLPEENAIILTFGKWTATRGEPGLGYHLPWPVQEVLKVNVAFDRRIEIGFREKESRRAFSREQAGGVTRVMAESQMVTGDENIVDIDFVVMWNISDARKYLFEVRDPETTIKKVAESAMREIVGRSKIQSALTDGRAEIESKTKELMQHMLDEYNAGVVVNNVQLLRVDPPEPVVDAFDDVQRARADKERARNEGETYRNDVVPRARGEAKQLLQGAEAYRESVVSKAQGDAERFLSVYAAYKQDKDITKKRLYIETMQEIMRNSKKVIVGNERGNQVLPYLSLDQLKKN